MSNGEIDPFSGNPIGDPAAQENEFASWDGDPAAQEIDFSWLREFDDDVVGTVYEPRPESCQPPQDVPNLCGGFNVETEGIKTVNEQEINGQAPDASIGMEQSVAPVDVPNLEEAIEAFQNNNEKFRFCIEQDPPNCVLKNGTLYIKPETAVKIKVEGAQTGQMVKASVRFKNKTHCLEPVMVCSDTNHQKLDGQSLGGTLYVRQKSPVTFLLEEEHPTAFISLTEEEGCCIYPHFKCTVKCFEMDQKKKSQEMILSLYDVMGTEVLHQTTFDVRVCAQPVRDSKRGNGKYPRKTAAKRPLQDEAQTSDSQQEVGAPPPKTRYFMVEMEDSQLVTALYAVAKYKGKVIELDPASHPEECFQNAC